MQAMLPGEMDAGRSREQEAMTPDPQEVIVRVGDKSFYGVGRRELRERRASDKALNDRIKTALANGASSNAEFLHGDVSASCRVCGGRGLVANGRGHFGAGFFDDEGISQLPMREALCVCQHCFGSGRDSLPCVKRPKK